MSAYSEDSDFEDFVPRSKPKPKLSVSDRDSSIDQTDGRDHSTGNDRTRDHSTADQSTRHDSTKDQSTREYSARSHSTGDNSTRDRSRSDNSTRDNTTASQSTRHQSTRDNRTRDQGTRDKSTRDQNTTDHYTSYQSTRNQRTRDQSTIDHYTRYQNTRGQRTKDQTRKEESYDTYSMNTTEFVQHELCQRDYYNSSFPSLMSHLGPRGATKAKTKKKASSMPSKFGEDNFPTVHEETNHHLSKKKMKDNMTFTEKMKRFNESRWLRIESVAQQKMNHYDKYVSDMNTKLKQQRARIEKRATQQLQHLARLEERKREDMLFQSPFGRMWRHHRTMQRRAYSLEKIHPTNTGFSIQSPRSTRTLS